MVATGAAPPGAFLRLYLNGSLLASVTAGANGLWSLTVEHGMKGGAYAIRADEIDRTKDVVISRAEVPFNYPEHVAELAAVKPPAPAPAPSAPPPVVAPARQPAVANQQKPIVTETPAVAAPSAAPPPVASVPPTAAVDAPPPAPTPATQASDRAAPAPAPPPPEREAAVAPSTPPPQTTPAGATPPGAAHAIVRLVDTRRIVPGDNLWTISEQLYGNGLRYTQIYAANAAQIRNPWLIYPGQIFVLPQPTPN
jgi:nucleoid-associated protein YgaU